jgi:uncharacterized protein (TIGR02147 family)
VSMSEATRFNCDGDFRLFLQKELDRRKKTNPKYSMRAFAGFLQIDVRRLSKYLRDERPMGVDFIEKAGARLMLTPEDITVFRSGAEARLAVASYQDTAKELAGYTQLSSEVFESIEHWRHYAILELMKVRSFQNDPQWIANALRISRKEADQYIQRLLKVGLIEVLPDGSWRDVSEGKSLSAPDEFETTAVQQHIQKLLMINAVDALDQYDRDERDHAAVIMATDPSRVAGAKKMINKFLVDLCHFLEGGERKELVYQLSVALFPLVKPDAER